MALNLSLRGELTLEVKHGVRLTTDQIGFPYHPIGYIDYSV